jgi:hypothetical protein
VIAATVGHRRNPRMRLSAALPDFQPKPDDFLYLGFHSVGGTAS